MTKSQNISKITKFSIKLSLILGGTILLIGWAVLLGITSLLESLPCSINPSNCTDGRSLANLILFSPIVLGAFILPAGILFNSNTSREMKVAISLISAITLFFVAYWIIALVGIFVHGFGA